MIELGVFFVLLASCLAYPGSPDPSLIGVQSNIILTPFSNVGDTLEHAVGSSAAAKTISFSPKFPDSGRQYAILEHPSQESITNQLDIKYGNVQSKVANLYHPKPIVDQIQEYEKYGNTGEKFRGISTAVVSGAEAFSRALNTAIEFPFTKFKQISKSATTSLDTLGGRLVGLS